VRGVGAQQRRADSHHIVQTDDRPDGLEWRHPADERHLDGVHVVETHSVSPVEQRAGERLAWP
jgi:hypothetical protein